MTQHDLQTSLLGSKFGDTHGSESKLKVGEYLVVAKFGSGGKCHWQLDEIARFVSEGALKGRRSWRQFQGDD